MADVPPPRRSPSRGHRSTRRSRSLFPDFRQVYAHLEKCELPDGNDGSTRHDPCAPSTDKVQQRKIRAGIVRVNQKLYTPEGQLCIPTPVRQTLMTEFHTSDLAGHRGPTTMLNMLRSRFYCTARGTCRVGPKLLTGVMRLCFANRVKTQSMRIQFFRIPVL